MTPSGSNLVDHDALVKHLETMGASTFETEFWAERGGYSWPGLGRDLLGYLRQFAIKPSPTKPQPPLSNSKSTLARQPVG